MIISLSIIKYICSYVNDNNIPDNHISKNIKNIENKFISEYETYEYPFGFKKEKFLSLTHKLFIRYSELIKTGILYETLDVLLKNQSIEVSSSYKRSLNSINELLSHVKMFSFNETRKDKSIIEILNDYDIHNPDARILLDAFRVSEIINEYVYFITKDIGIINNSDIISDLFDDKPIPKKPEDFTNN